jgi:hypothetical protein
METEKAMSEKPNPRKFKTGYFRMSFPALLKPRKNDEGNERFELTMLFPPGEFEATRKAAMAAMTAAMTEKYGDDKSKWPKLKRKPTDVIRDFDEYNSESNKPLKGDWKGWTMMRANASTKMPPNIVGQHKGENGKFPAITDEREVYGGRWARASLEAYVYDRKDGKGVTLGIVNVQLAKHDKKFGGAVTAAEEDFDDVSDEWAGAGDAFDSGEQASTREEEDAPW